MSAETVTSSVLLVLAGVLALPQYHHPLRRLGDHPHAALYLTAALQLLLLGAAAILAVMSPSAAGGAGGLDIAWAAPVAVMAATVGGGAPTAAVLTLSFNATHPEHQPVLTGPDGETVFNEELDTQPVLRGGSWIGVLERMAVSATLLLGWPEGLAIILAVKGLGRYSELGKSGAAERFILGTFASQLWACACVGVGLLLI